MRTAQGQRRGAAWGLAIVLCAVLLATLAAHDGRLGGPVWHDEQVYLVQTRQLLAGTPAVAPPAEDARLFRFFAANHLLTEPTYAGKYPPGAALFYAPAALLSSTLQALGMRFTVADAIAFEGWSLLSSAATVMLIAWIGFRLAGLAGAVLAGLCVLSAYEFRLMGSMVMSHVPMLLLAAGSIACFVRWRDALQHGRGGRRIWGWSLAIGACVGWLLATRPADGVTWGVPLALAAVATLVRRRPTARRVIAAVVPAVAGLLPFALLVGWFNVAATGSPLRLPYWVYESAATPACAVERAAELGGQSAEEARQIEPALGALAAKRLDLLLNYTLPKSEGYRTFDGIGEFAGFVTWAFANTVVPHNTLLLLLPAALLLARGRGRRPPTGLLATSAVFAALVYARYPHVEARYLLPALPAAALLMVAGLRETGSLLPRPAAGAAWGTAIALAVLPLVPEARPSGSSPIFGEEMLAANAAVAEVVEQAAPADESAVIFFRFVPGRTDVHDDPVYNTQSAAPCGSRVVRANDLGDDNVNLLRHLLRCETFGQKTALRVYAYDQLAPPGDRLRHLGDAGTVVEAIRRHGWEKVRAAGA